MFLWGQMRNHLSKNDLELQNLNGPVKVLIEKKLFVKHTSDSTFVLEDNMMDWEGQIINFNKSGYKTEHLIFDLGENSILDSLQWLFKYDSRNRKTKKLHFAYGSSDTTITTYSYPNDTLVLERNDKVEIRHVFSEDQEIIYSVNADGYTTKRLYQYDKAGRMLRYEDYEDKEFIQHLHLYFYKDSLTPQISRQLNIGLYLKNSVSFYDREHDEFGNTIKIFSGRFDKKDTHEFRMTYEYDNKGNWIRMEYYDQRNRLSEIRARTITYY